MYQRYQNRVELTWPETGLTWTMERRFALHAPNASAELPRLADGGPALWCAAAPCAAPRFPAKIGARGSLAAPAQAGEERHAPSGVSPRISATLRRRCGDGGDRRAGRHPGIRARPGLRAGDDAALAALERLRAGLRPAAAQQDRAGSRQGARDQAQHRD